MVLYGGLRGNILLAAGPDSLEQGSRLVVEKPLAMKQIKLTLGQLALVDDTDWAWLSAMGRWSAQKRRHGFCAQLNFK